MGNTAGLENIDKIKFPASPIPDNGMRTQLLLVGPILIKDAHINPIRQISRLSVHMQARNPWPESTRGIITR